MGMHLGLVAVKSSVDELIAAFTETWPQYEIALRESLPDGDAMWAWKDKHAQFVSSAAWSPENRGRKVYLFWQDGPWAVMFDDSYVLAGDEKGLSALSQRFGTALSFIIESASGCAFFEYYEQGTSRRKILNNGEECTTEGTALAQEADIDIDNYYMDATEALWEAFGLSSISKLPTSIGCQAICAIDQTDYSQRKRKGKPNAS